MLNFRIDERGYTFSHVLDREVKLSPAMQRLVRALSEHGHVDPIRDFGRGTGVGTVVALMDRGIIREAKGRHRIHMPATTPAQAWDEAHAEHARRAAEQAAHEMDPERWTQTVDENGDELHVRKLRTGHELRVVRRGPRFWRIFVPNSMIDRSAGGTAEEARAAGDRCERDVAHTKAAEDYREVTRAARQADSAAYQRELAASVKPSTTKADALLQADLKAARADGIALPIAPPMHPEGAPEYAAYAAELRTELAKFAAGEEPYPYEPAAPADALAPLNVDSWSDPLPGVLPAITPAETQEDVCGCDRNPLGHSRAEHPVKREYSAQLGGYVVQDASGRWHREPATPAEARNGGPRVWVDSGTHGDRREVKIMLTGTDHDHINLIDQLEILLDGRARQAPAVQALYRTLCDRTALVAATWPPEPNTPAEARTGISDRAAAALNEAAKLRRMIIGVVGEMHAGRGLLDQLDRIEHALRAGDAR